MCFRGAGEIKTGCSKVMDLTVFVYYHYMTAWILTLCAILKIENKHQQKSKVNAATGILPVWDVYCWAIGLWGFWMTVVCGIAWRKVHLGWIFTLHWITQNWRYWNSTQDYRHSLIHRELSSCDGSEKCNVNTTALSMLRKNFMRNAENEVEQTNRDCIL